MIPESSRFSLCPGFVLSNVCQSGTNYSHQGRGNCNPWDHSKTICGASSSWLTIDVSPLGVVPPQSKWFWVVEGSRAAMESEHPSMATSSVLTTRFLPWAAALVTFDHGLRHGSANQTNRLLPQVGLVCVLSQQQRSKLGRDSKPRTLHPSPLCNQSLPHSQSITTKSHSLKVSGALWPLNGWMDG